MKLKSVRIFGFKTFADRTDLELDGDLIAVVGPNGCGKSNIVDAMLWALGESNVRNLRASQSSDIIFNGSSGRRALGFAEVTLTFDNEDGELAVDSPDVSLTRRLSRNGTSEFFINRRSCRLKDIVELLADSGLGRTGYAIVGQREIDAALSASPVERRSWIDEAAGVQKYRARRADAVKRLEAACQHLVRVDDLLLEIGTQLGPLEIDSKKATEYKRLQSALREIESGMLIVELNSAMQDLNDLQTKSEQTQTQRRLLIDTIREQEEVSQQTAERISDLEQQLDHLRTLRESALTAVERSEGGIQLGLQKITSLDQFEQNLKSESQTARERIQEAESDVINHQDELASLRKGLEEIQLELTGSAELARDLQIQFNELDKALEVARSLELRRLEQEAEAKNARTRSKAIRTELQGIQDARPELKNGVDEAHVQCEALLREKNESLSKARELEQAAAQKTARARQEELRAGELRSDVARLEGKLRGIQATLDAHEGLSHGARAVLKAAQEGILEDEYLCVGDAVGVDPELATAIECALMSSVHDLITRDSDSAKTAIEFLKEHRLGRATFQPRTMMRPSGDRAQVAKLLSQRGVVGMANTLIDCADEDRVVFDSLLGRIVVCENLDAALRLKGLAGWQRIVTLSGEVLFSSGAIQGGVSDRSHDGIVHRRAELITVQKECNSKRESLEKIESEVEKLRLQAEKDLESAAAWQKNWSDREIDLEEAQGWLASLKHEWTDLVRAEERLNKELQAIGTQASEKIEVVDIKAIEERHQQMIHELAKRGADTDLAEQRLLDAESAIASAEKRSVEAKRRLELAQTHQSSREKRQSGLKESRDECNLTIIAARQAKAAAEQQLAELQIRFDKGTVERRHLLEENFQWSEKIKVSRDSLRSSDQMLQSFEVQNARLDLRRSIAAQRLIEDFCITQEDAVHMAAGIHIAPESAQEAGRLRRDLKALGDVNLGAIDAYQTLSERHSDLSNQRQDILDGKASVEEGIRELDRHTRERFDATFELVQGAFRETFTTLFGGGEAELTKQPGTDDMDAGVEVNITLPGKRRQRLELLSGGERALSALAFLFALLKVRPSPLVVLDEVDAPLDGRNVERMIALLESLNGVTQFLVITHNPATIEAAPMWLGVTMQEPGVTTIVPYRSSTTKVVADVIASAFLTEANKN